MLNIDHFLCFFSTQVGKALRQGPYGVCFDPNSRSGAVGAGIGAAAGVGAGNPRLLAARPGKRLWLADAVTAEVLSTLK